MSKWAASGAMDYDATASIFLPPILPDSVQIGSDVWEWCLLFYGDAYAHQNDVRARVHRAIRDIAPKPIRRYFDRELI